MITCEYTGGLEQPLLIACSEANLPIAVINPKQARDFARAILDPTPAPHGLGSLGKHAKTDAIDAVMLAEFATRMRPDITVPSSEHVRALEAITSRRRQLLEMLTSDHARQVRLMVKKGHWLANLAVLSVEELRGLWREALWVAGHTPGLVRGFFGRLEKILKENLKLVST